MGAARGGISLALVLAACAEPRATVALPSDDPCRSLADGPSCLGDVALRCVAGKTAERTSCTSKGQSCVRDVGCRTCVPYAISCEGSQRYRCSVDGQRKDLVESCPDGLLCSAGGCRDLCADARADRSYLGCEYWPVFTVNHQLASPFAPAVAVGNGNLVTAHVKVTRGGGADAAPVATLELAPRSADTIVLAYDPLLQRSTSSMLVRGGAYHLTSDVPVTVHQFNPLLFEVPGDCPAADYDRNRADKICNSYTNDASLLFPDESLGPDVAAGATDVRYLVLSRATFVVDPGIPSHSSAGFVAIVAGGDKAVNVRVKLEAFTSVIGPGDAGPGAEPVPPLPPGTELAQVLMPGDVLQLQSAVPDTCSPVTPFPEFAVCDPGRDYDLTGTEVTADGPIEVIGGHDCSFVPFDRPACDHLEESLPPVSAWGTWAVVTQPQVAPDASTMVRVISGTDGNQVRFDPALRAPLTLNRGEFVELLAAQPLAVRGSGPLLVGQYLIGQGGSRFGDPSLSIAVPVDQYRASYNFVTPATYTANFVDVIAPTGDGAMLDGELVEGFTPVGSSGFSVATVPISRAGAHEISGKKGYGIGLVLYGVGAYTSYMLPGGLDLATLTVGI